MAGVLNLTYLLDRKKIVSAEANFHPYVDKSLNFTTSGFSEMPGNINVEFLQILGSKSIFARIDRLLLQILFFYVQIAQKINHEKK